MTHDITISECDNIRELVMGATINAVRKETGHNHSTVRNHANRNCQHSTAQQYDLLCPECGARADIGVERDEAFEACERGGETECAACGATTYLTARPAK